MNKIKVFFFTSLLALITMFVAVDMGQAATGGIIAALTGGTKAFTTIKMNQNEKITQPADAQVAITADDDATTLLSFMLQSTNSPANLSDNDLIQILFRAYDSASNLTSYATVQGLAADVTTTTEDGTIIQKIMVAGSDTTKSTLDSTGLTIVGDVSGTTIGGITEANLVDKTGAETISGIWSFGSGDMRATLPMILTAQAAGAETNTMLNSPDVNNNTAPKWFLTYDSSTNIYVVPGWELND